MEREMPTMEMRHTADLDDATRVELRALLDTAFDGKFEDTDWEHALGGMHVVVYDGAELVGHGSVVQRVLVHDDVPLRCGYLEAIAVRADRRGRGIGGEITRRLTSIVRRGYQLGALSASDDGRPVYERCGWELWRGPLTALTPDGIEQLPDERGAVMVLEVDGGAQLDLDASLMADWRSGEIW